MLTVNAPKVSTIEPVAQVERGEGRSLNTTSKSVEKKSETEKKADGGHREDGENSRGKERKLPPHHGSGVGVSCFFQGLIYHGKFHDAKKKKKQGDKKKNSRNEGK